MIWQSLEECDVTRSSLISSEQDLGRGLCENYNEASWKLKLLYELSNYVQTAHQKEVMFFYRCTVHSDIHTVQSPTDALLLKSLINI